MKTIKIREAGDEVFYIEASGIKHGYIHRVQITQDNGRNLEIKYFVKHSTDCDVYGGSQKAADQLHDKLDTLLVQLKEHVQY